MRYGSVCSGIEAATMAWHPLGWEPAFFSEIENFPSAVLAHHYPHVPNLGDMTKFQEWPDEPIDLLVGGTPCQSFSVAGLRAGLADPRGNLALTYLAIAAKYQPRWILWENVPGVFSSLSHDAPDPCPPPDPVDMELDGQEVGTVDEYDADETHAFGTFLAGLSELGYGVAYRTLDAQFCRAHGYEWAVPQRRRRVFVVGYLGDWRRAAAVLFDGTSLRGDPAPRREAGKGTSTDVVSSLTASGRGVERTGETRGQDPVVAVHAVAPTLNAAFGSKLGLENQHIDSGAGMFVAHALRGEGFDASEDGTGRGIPLVPEVAGTMKAVANSGGWSNSADHAAAGYMVPESIVMMERGRNGQPTLETRQDGTANAILTPNGGRGGLGVGAVAFAQNQRDEVRTVEVAGALAAEPGMKQQTYLAHAWAVRRLTPVECARLQGFPDDYLSQVIYRGKPPADGPMYKALGNSMAVNVMRVIGTRIAMVDAIAAEQEAAA